MDKIIDPREQRRASRRRYMKWGAAAVTAAIAAATLLMVMEKKVDPRDIALATVDTGDLETTVSAQGRVIPAYEEIINSPVTTRVLRLFAQPGDSVKAGMPLLELDLETERANYGKAQDRYDISRRELTQLRLASETQLSELAMQIEVKEMDVNRMRLDADNERRLDSLGSGTGERVRQAETAYATGVLELRQLREKLANERLRGKAAEEVQELNVNTSARDLELLGATLTRGSIPAPRDGVLTFITTEIGAQVGAGEKVAVVSDLSSFKIIGEVAEGSSDRVGVGSTVTVRLGSKRLSGTVTNITPQAKGGLMEFAVILDDPREPRLRSGLRVEMQVNYGYKEHVTRLPAGSFFTGPGTYSLFVLDGDHRMARREVRLGDSNREYIEVLSGLRPGDRVAVGDMEPYKSQKSLKLKQ